MTVGVVIPCRNESRWLGGVLNALAAQTVAPDEVVMVDDGSTDDTAGVIERWRRQHGTPRVKVVAGPGRGIAAAVTAGVAALGSEIIVRLDGHCRPEPDYVERALALMGHDDIGVVGGVWAIEPAAPTMEAQAIAIAMAHPLGSGGAMYRRSTVAGLTDVDTVPFGCFKRSLWTRLGGLTEELRSNEDYEFNYRVRQLGLRVVLDPAIRCTYYARSTIAGVIRQYSRYGWWKARMILRHPRSIQWRQLIPALLVPTLLAAALATALEARGIWVIIVCYLLAIVAGALHAATTRRRWAAAGWLVGAFLAIQVAWSAAFWLSLASAALSRDSGES